MLLEAAASQDLWIYHAFFGVFRSNNDINVVRQSPIFNYLKDGKAQEVLFASGVIFSCVMFPYQVGDVPLSGELLSSFILGDETFLLDRFLTISQMSCCRDSYMGLLDFIKTVDPRKVQAVEVQKKDDQVKLLERTSHCFMSLVTPAAGGSSSAAAPKVSALVEVEPENVVPEDTYLDLTGPDEVFMTQSGKSKRKRLGEAE
ncbi:ALP1-like protein isoform X1 [Tanacetum coccineum]